MSKNPAYFAIATCCLDAGLQVLGWTNTVVGVLLLAIAGTTALYAVIDWSRLPPHFRRSFAALNGLSFSLKMPLQKAARIAYEEARASGSVWAHAAERLAVNKTPEGILDYFAAYFAGEVPLFGKRPPSTREEVIDQLQAKHGVFSDGAKTLTLRDKSRTSFIDLRVEKKNLAQMVEAVRQGLKVDSQI
jgi:hypothetical protein